MNNYTASQELLLNTTSGYCRRQCDKKKNESKEKKQRATAAEQLKSICRDGLLPELLPEVCLKVNNKPLVLWEMMGMDKLLHLKLGGFNQSVDPDFSIHPYLIMQHVGNN